ncbi:MAG: hypothetical protein JXQ72_02710, partial [Anaerolineae bacterium]|nr:hypothetical protein [Anaerolineae bacterium]
LSVLAVWIAWVMVQTRARWVALVLGGSLALVLLAKASGVVWLPLPAVALILGQKLSWRKRAELGVLAYGTFAGIAGPLLVVLRVKGYDYFSLASVFTGGVNRSVPDRIWSNIQNLWHFDAAYLGLPVIVLAAAGGVYWLSQQPRRALWAVFALGMGGGGAVVFGNAINSRYALNHVAWVLLPLAAGIALLIERARTPRQQWIVWGIVGTAGAIWLVVFVLPFQRDTWNDPAALDLYGDDPRQYVEQEASGYGVTELGEWLSSQADPLPVLGLVANCQTLRLAAYPVDVTCPAINWDGTSQRAIMAQAERWAAKGPLYVVGEQLPYIDLAGLPQPYTIIDTVARPGGSRSVTLFRIDQGAVGESRSE